MRRVSTLSPAAGSRLCALLLAALAPAVATGCTAISEGGKGLGLPIENWQDVTPTPQPRLQVLQYRHDVPFDPGDPTMPPAARQSLLRFLADVPAGGGETAYVVAAPSTAAPSTAAPSTAALAERRFAAVGAVLSGDGWTWRRGVLDDGAASPLAADSIGVVIEVTAVALPPCPNWSGWPQDTFSNWNSSNFGCATAINLGLQIANPEDLARGRQPGLSDGTVMSRSIERYREGKTKELLRDSATSDSFAPAAGQ